ncbi:MAG: hypothetical protein AB7F32_03740 [Victivallaceae bacterium]
MIYFDHASAMAVRPDVYDAFREFGAWAFVNQEAGHEAGYRVRTALDEAGERLAAKLVGRPMTVLWGETGSGLLHALSQYPWRGVECSGVLHPAVKAAFRAFAGAAPELRVIGHVQSETGELAAMPGPGAPVLVDAIQSAGKLPMLPGAAAYLISGHKFGSPGGAALLCEPGLGKKLKEHFHRLRFEHYALGRPEPTAILTMVYALEKMTDAMVANLARVTTINRFLRDNLGKVKLKSGASPILTVDFERASPWICHLVLPGIDTGVLVRMLSGRGVMAASSAACRAEGGAPSEALLALGFPKADARSGLRLSFAPSNTLSEAADFLDLLQSALADY